MFTLHLISDCYDQRSDIGYVGTPSCFIFYFNIDIFEFDTTTTYI